MHGMNARDLGTTYQAMQVVKGGDEEDGIRVVMRIGYRRGQMLCGRLRLVHGYEAITS